jgi:hypothetical protein
VDDSDDPRVALMLQRYRGAVRFKASGEADDAEFKADTESDNELKYIVDTAHQAYLQATTIPF